MAQDIRVILFQVLNKEEEYSNGVMVKYMMVNGKMVRKMEVECGKVQMVSHILDNGKMVKFKDLVSML